MTTALMESRLPYQNRRQGKVRDVYEAVLEKPVGGATTGQRVVVIVASDRLSAFDVVMPDPIPGKGVILTAVSNFWFEMIGQKLGDRLGHHLLSTSVDDLPGVGNMSAQMRRSLRGRVVIGRRCEVVPIECVVRGYLAGSGWAEYQRSGVVCGVALPAGLRRCDKLPEPIFTPATKAATGHDQNIPFEWACELVGHGLMHRLRAWSIELYRVAAGYAAARGILIADTKFEFGIPTDGGGDGPAEPILIDEALTPDSSRFWPADRYQPGREPESFDKQFVRNYLEGLVAEGRWAKSPPGPPLPPEVVRGTLDRYRQAHRLLTGREVDL